MKNSENRAVVMPKCFEKQIYLNSDTILLYSELPTTKGSHKLCEGSINGVPCSIFRRRSFFTVLNYLMRKYPIMEYFLDDRDFAPSIIDCFVSHERAYKFEIDHNEETHEMVAILDAPLWETADEDLFYLLNLIHYVRDYQDNPDGVFMDDYGLC